MNNEEIQKLIKENELLKQQLSAKDIKIESLQSEVNWLSDQLTLFRKAKFASTSEKTKIYEQMELDFGNEAEMEADPNESEEKIRITYDRKKKAKKRKVNLQLEPDRTIIVDIDPSEKIDPDTGKPLECIGSRKHRELVHHKEYYEIIEYVQYRYAKKDQETGETEVICKPIPTSVLPQSYASSSILASVIEKKYAMHVPLYRQEQLYHRQGLELSRQTMANWIIALYNNYFDLFIEHMHSELLKATHIMCDETTQKIVMIKHNEGRENCYVWVYMPNRGEDKKFVIYQFEHDRKQERVQEYLKGYRGVITSDGYSAYSSVDNVVQANCWAHCRRYYTRVLDTAGKNVNLKETVTWKLVNKINELFSLEDQYNRAYKEDYTRIREARIEYSKKKVDEFFEIAHETYPAAVEGTLLHKALTYSINHEEGLRYFLEDGKVELSSNEIERRVKSFVMSRKNFLFSYTEGGARASEAVYSIVESAKMNNLKPYEYIRYILDEMKGKRLTDDLLERLMPWSNELPRTVRLKK